MQANDFTGVSLTSPDKNNLQRLKAISKSFDDLTSETLYSRWKKARKNATQRPRSASVRSSSLLSLPQLEELDENGNEIGACPGQESSREGPRQIVSRPRGWTVCSGEISRSVTPVTDGSDSVISDSYASSEVTDTASIGMESDSGIEEQKTPISRSSTPSVDSSEVSEDDAVFVSTSPTARSHLKWFPRGRSVSDVTDCLTWRTSTVENKKITKESLSKENVFVTEITTTVHGKLSKKVRSLSDGDQLKYEQPIKARLLSSRNRRDIRKRSLSAREPRELQFLRTAEMARQYLNNSVSSLDDVWLKRDAVGTAKQGSRHKRPSGVDFKHKGLVNNNIHGPTLGQIPDRSHQCSSLGTTYTVVHQPIDSSIHRDSNHSRAPAIRKTSAPAPTTTFKLAAENTDEEQELRDKLPSEVSRGDSLSLSRSSYGQVGRSRSFAGEHGHRAATMPRLARRATSVLSNRKASELRSKQIGKELLDKITKAEEKSEKDRLDVVERAFEWIRKELADLRAQDKDIMRMFTKIQAGIRHLKFDQSLLLESAEDDFNSSPDLSQSFSYSPTSKEQPQPLVPRRASLL